jgi:hypothetical protein
MEGYNNHHDGHPAAPGMMGYQDYQSPEEGMKFIIFDLSNRNV